MAAAILLGCVACGGGGQALPDAGAADAAAATYADPVTRIGSATLTTGDVTEILIRSAGELAVCGSTGISFVDVSDPTAPKETATLTDSGGCTHLALDGDTLWVARRFEEIGDTSKLAAYDLSKAPAELVEQIVIAAKPFQVIAADGRAYVGQHGRGVGEYSVQDGKIVQVGTIAGPGNEFGLSLAFGLALVGKTLYVGDALGKLFAFDLTNPDAPVMLGETPVAPKGPWYMTIHQNRAYLGMGEGGLAIVDVTDPTDMRQLGALDTPGHAERVTAFGETVIIGDWDDARIVDVSDPAQPRLAATEYQGGRVKAVTATPEGVLYSGAGSTLSAFTLDLSRSGPDVWVAQRQLYFPQLASGEAALALIVRNEGQAPLIATDVRIGAPFTVTPASFTLGPGEARALDVTFAPTSAAEVSDDLKIMSDDADEPALAVAVHGNSDLPTVGNPLPEVTVSLVEGGAWSTSEHLGEVLFLAYFRPI